MTNTKNSHSHWQTIFKLGGIAAISAVSVGVLEILITFLPGGNTPQETMLDWFILFEHNWFLGLRNLGLLNIFFNILAILTYFALYATHRESPYQPYAALATVISFTGIGVFLATNRAFPMLALSQRFASATTDAQRGMLVVVAQAMLSVGASHTPGTFLGFFLSEVAGVLISFVMLRSEVFSNATAYVGMLGFGILMIFEFFSSFVAGLSAVAIGLAMIGGLLSMTWYILIAQRLFQLGRNPASPS